MDFSVPEPQTHEPVLLEEVLRLLDPQKGQVIVDGTLGSGGHAREILKRIGTSGRLIAIDQDPEAIERAKKVLKEFPQAVFIQENFSSLDEILRSLNLEAIDAVLLDVGVSSEQLEAPERGFSFLKEGPLDMRMDPRRAVMARDLVNGLSQEELEGIFRAYGEERWARRIAGTICRERIRNPVRTTADLVRIIEKAVPRPYLFRRRHPATQVFQALRIQVNEELDALKETLPKALKALREGGRMAVISFHSLEDRIVKQTFQEWGKMERVKILTRKPLVPTLEEIERNPRSRSAKLRAAQKVEANSLLK